MVAAALAFDVAVVAGDGGVTVVGGHDLSDQLVTYHVLGFEMHECDVVDAAQDAFDGGQSRARHGQVHLRDIAGDDHRGVEAQTGQEHLHLLFGGVLSLVEDHERVVQRTAAHVGERRHFDGAVVHVPLELVGAEHVAKRVVQRAQIRVNLVIQRAGQKAEAFAGLHGRAREDDAANLLVLEGTHSLGHGQIRLAGACGANAEGDGVRFDGVHVGHLSGGFRTDRHAGGKGDDAGNRGLAVRRVVGAGRTCMGAFV